MSLTGNSVFIPNGPLIPSDALSSKSKIDGMAKVVASLVLPTYASTVGIISPAAGMLIFNSTTGKLNFYNGTAWEAVTSA